MVVRWQQKKATGDFENILSFIMEPCAKRYIKLPCAAFTD